MPTSKQLRRIPKNAFCYTVFFQMIDMHLYVRIDVWEKLTKKQKQHLSRRHEHGLGRYLQGREGRTRWGTSSNQRTERWTSSRSRAFYGSNPGLNLNSRLLGRHGEHDSPCIYAEPASSLLRAFFLSLPTGAPLVYAYPHCHTISQKLLANSASSCMKNTLRWNLTCSILRGNLMCSHAC